MTQLATFTLADHLFGVEVSRVQEVLRYQPSTKVYLAPEAIGGLMNLRGQVVTSVDLRRRLSLQPRTQDAEPMNVVVRVDGEVVSLLVDQIGDVVDVADDVFETPPSTLSAAERELITGAYKLQDRLLLALDIDKAVDVG
ncbi:purine-binding chemotaxis protein CheW [Motilibacter rhizosphaerae]|uniref:Purine-binding chemotaxis protein CheW n=1 Tax=Motilibacter rhizosphaerae TaxID=598652 RepID=A0A4Q7NW11_9ACTN|nr:chemotaxis protein CheW [Motilibacter rhizosphaerae]RZS91385.1 purine-binding chemotaxis protein CheW [Motilibacter rhizosphaerae]